MLGVSKEAHEPMMRYLTKCQPASEDDQGQSLLSVQTAMKKISADLDDTISREVELYFYGFFESDLDREFVLPLTTFIDVDRIRLTLKAII
uniref:Uncharacterized protein n=1 Tax=Ditylenchus dipsaci TaxID=166011 RepID=A0A915CMP4_9BILA